MIAVGILRASVMIALLSPLFSAILLSLTYFKTSSPKQLEKVTYRLLRFFGLLILSSAIVAFFLWYGLHLAYGSFSLAHFTIGPDFSVTFRIFFDGLSLIFLLTSSLITAMVIFFSHRYLHRDPGYRRFFIVISLFTFGINLIILAGSFDLIFAGWEIVGLSSYLLIGYFWHRPKAIAAACRAYYVYRVCDLGLLASLLITHFFWHDISIFSDLVNLNHHTVLSEVSSSWKWLLSVCILLPVLGKSAQFPLCFWLPKAMEGPTHSSAIFYGSLSIHAGVFLLIRTMPIWHNTPGFDYLLAFIGITTAVSASIFALVQSNIKGQIGYASIAQVGLMLFELSLGWSTIAFIHMIGNAFLRCFQLLVSSSILTTHLHMQNVIKTWQRLKKFSLPEMVPKRLWPSLFVFAINEGFFEAILKTLFVRPVLFLADIFNAIVNVKIRRSPVIHRLVEAPRPSFVFFSLSPLAVVLSLGVLMDLLLRQSEVVRLFSLGIAFMLSLAALGEKENALRGLKLATFGNLFALLSITNSKPGLLYLIGLITSAFVAIEALQFIRKRRTIPDLKNHHGLYQQFPLAGTVLLLGVLGVVSFPFASTFYGEDILLNLTIGLGVHYLIIFQFIFIVCGLALIRFYSLVMFGKRNNEIKGLDLDFRPWQALIRVAIFFLGNASAFFLALS